MNVIIISHSIIPSVLLCGHSELTYLKNNNKVDYHFVKTGKINAADLSWADIVVFLRSESYLEAYASQQIKGKKHTVYVMDDDLLNVPKYASSSYYYNLKGVKKNIVEIMNNCDTFLTPSKVLLEKYGKSFKYADLIKEPSLNSIKEKNTSNKRIKIGFAGSIDRTQDINDILEDTLVEIINKYHQKVDIEFMGAKPKIVNEYGLKYVPYQNGYKKYTEIIKERNWDIGLAPMPITEFHNCKYFNKYVEYASFGIAGVYTNTEPYISGIKDGENGLLANNTKEEWVNAISRLIEDEKLRNKISNNSIKEANTIYSLDTLVNDYFTKITKNYIDKGKQEIVFLQRKKIKIFFIKLIDQITLTRWKFPFWCVKYIVLKLLSFFGIREKVDNVEWE